MDRADSLLAEIQILGTICKQTGGGKQSAEIVQTLEPYAFLDPEHQVVFESIRSLFVHNHLSNARLAVHLNNRGFPDVDLEKYCAAALANIEDALSLARRVSSSTQNSVTNARYDSHGKGKHDI